MCTCLHPNLNLSWSFTQEGGWWKPPKPLQEHSWINWTRCIQLTTTWTLYSIFCCFKESRGPFCGPKFIVHVTNEPGFGKSLGHLEVLSGLCIGIAFKRDCSGEVLHSWFMLIWKKGKISRWSLMFNRFCWIMSLSQCCGTFQCCPCDF